MSARRHEASLPTLVLCAVVIAAVYIAVMALLIGGAW